MKLPLAYQHVVYSYTKPSHANNELFHRTRLDKVTNFVALFRKNLRTFKKHVTFNYLAHVTLNQYLNTPIITLIMIIRL